MFLIQNLMLNLNQFKYFIYHERIQRYKSFIDLTHLKNTKTHKSNKRDIKKIIKKSEPKTLVF